MYVLLFSLFCFTLTACAQNKVSVNGEAKTKAVGGPCEGCEAIYESPVAFENLPHVDTLPIFSEKGSKLIVSGTVYRRDSRTPAPDVVLYIYQTDQTGNYRKTGTETGWGQRHGSIRGWMKTNTKGEYRFYTIRPAAYSKTGPPAHIHVTVKEPDMNEYYIDDFEFDDDLHLTADLRKRKQNRGGNGILKLQKKKDIFYGERTIVLGMNITGYPL